jgi:4,5-DOPA dioxygenase extradiol
MLALTKSPAQDFLRRLGTEIEKPRAAVIASPHFPAREPVVVADPHPAMIYDFGGFPDELYHITYPAPGDPDLAGEAAELIRAAGLPAHVVGERGFDHGTWVPLSLIWPDASVPIVQLSVEPMQNAAYHHALGRALAPLRDEDVLVIGTGAMTHNFQELFRGGMKPVDAPPAEWAKTFTDWIADRAAVGDIDALVDYVAEAPEATRAHPADDHFLPFFVALGAAGEGAKGERIHASIEYGALAMDAYRFG